MAAVALIVALVVFEAYCLIEVVRRPVRLLTRWLTINVPTPRVALLLGIAGAIGPTGDWLPSHLLGALTSLAAGGDVTDFIPSAVVTGAATAALILIASRLGDSRET